MMKWNFLPWVVNFALPLLQTTLCVIFQLRNRDCFFDKCNFEECEQSLQPDEKIHKGIRRQTWRWQNQISSCYSRRWFLSKKNVLQEWHWQIRTQERNYKDSCPSWRPYERWFPNSQLQKEVREGNKLWLLVNYKFGLPPSLCFYLLRKIITISWNIGRWESRCDPV